MTSSFAVVPCSASSAAVDPDEDHPLLSLPVGRRHSSSRSPQSPTRDVGKDMTREFSGVLSSGSVGRKTVRFADESPPPPDGDRSPFDGDVGYTIRPHYPTRVTLSTFHSNPTITSEL